LAEALVGAVAVLMVITSILDADGTTKLHHEIESFSVSGGAASMVAW
jgi:hypothetical protein